MFARADAPSYCLYSAPCSVQVGIVQVQAMPVRQASLFGRMFQFSATMFGEMLVQGYSWILLNAGTYIGAHALSHAHLHGPHHD